MGSAELLSQKWVCVQKIHLAVFLFVVSCGKSACVDGTHKKPTYLSKTVSEVICVVLS